MDNKIDDNSDYNLYVLAELNYKKQHENEGDIFPVDWYSSKDYKYKTQIIVEALINNITIEVTELFQNRFDNNKFIK